ncbi:hypothetical protein G7051_01355 [Dysgonomonas sp. HDW5B]|uniref:hypothetical protein n=1 Tax=Dysgonomonas sp. HDW5B TaxID=2714927 RepID=UPI00140969B6|nr:hypothetical protein [Dysgonomonas sp. HDW5B]QIK53067.1 hypothetical protein G7051_01355 [Dysgonomonas sp. HDW5B]
MKKIGLILSFMLFCFIYMKGQDTDMSHKLTSQGAWFLFSVRTEEQVGEEVLTQVEFYKKDDISSIFFDEENKLYSVFSKYSTDVYEDRWKLVDDTHFVMVSPNDGSSQIVEILEIDKTKLVLRNCGDIENGTSCSLYTYFSTKEGWLPDSEIDELNSAGIIEVEEMTP